MKNRFVIILIILLLGFLASRLRFDEPAPPVADVAVSTKIRPVTSQDNQPITSQNTLFNLNGEWRGVLQPVHGSQLDPRDWNLELKLSISAGQARVYIRRGEQWQEVKPGKFQITRHKTNAIVQSMDSGGGWVESWVFLLSRHDRDSMNIYGNRIINNFKQAADTPSARITYGATGRFIRVYEPKKMDNKGKSQTLNDQEIAAQIEQAVERGKRLNGARSHGRLRLLEHRVTQETNDSASLFVKYQYDGLTEDNAWISAVTFNEGKNTGHWSFRPVKLQRGKAWTQIHVGMNSQSPDEYCSDSFVIQAYIGGKGNFFEKAMPYKRCWSKK